MNDIFGPNRRLSMLQGMERDNDYSLSNEMLQRFLALFGHNIGIGEVNLEIDRLKKAGLVTVEALSGGIRLARLTRFGLDVARGHARCDGIDRPLPSE